MPNSFAIRYLDRHGRLGLPKYFRVILNWQKGDELQCEMCNGYVKIYKNVTCCAVCGCCDEESLYPCGEKQFLCSNCIECAWETKQKMK